MKRNYKLLVFVLVSLSILPILGVSAQAQQQVDLLVRFDYKGGAVFSGFVVDLESGRVLFSASSKDVQTPWVVKVPGGAKVYMFSLTRTDGGLVRTRINVSVNSLESIGFTWQDVGSGGKNILKIYTRCGEEAPNVSIIDISISAVIVEKAMNMSGGVCSFETEIQPGLFNISLSTGGFTYILLPAPLSTRILTIELTMTDKSYGSPPLPVPSIAQPRQEQQAPQQQQPPQGGGLPQPPPITYAALVVVAMAAGAGIYIFIKRRQAEGIKEEEIKVEKSSETETEERERTEEEEIGEERGDEEGEAGGEEEKRDGRDDEEEEEEYRK